MVAAAATYIPTAIAEIGFECLVKTAARPSRATQPSRGTSPLASPLAAAKATRPCKGFRAQWRRGLAGSQIWLRESQWGWFGVRYYVAWIYVNPRGRRLATA